MKDSMLTAMERCRKAEFAENLRRHKSQLFGFIYSQMRDYDDADDVFQQTSLILWRKYEQFDASRSFVGWAFGVARFEVAKFQRGRRRHRHFLSEEVCSLLVDIHEEFDHERLEEQRIALADCLKKLRPPDRELLLVCYGASTRIPEVARDRGRSPQSLYNTLRRIRRTLCECVLRTLRGKERG
jgi:RNA polymerase sigma-70 factor (ECF subfamily)